MATQLVAEIVGDATKFNKATQVAGGSALKMGAVIGVVSGLVSKGVDAVIDFGAEALKLGPKFEAMDAKAQTVFGSTLGVVQDWAAKNASAMGLTGREAVGLAANMGDLLIPMGFTREQAAGMSTDIVGLSGALSEWSGGTKSAAEVSEVLQKALLGEREGLKELGISISEADVKAQLLKDGTSELTGAALAQAKAQATQTLLFEKSTDAQSAYAAGTAEGIRTQHELDASLNTVKETLVEAVYPILKAVTKWLAENLPGAIKVVKDVITGLRPVFETVFGVLSTLVGFWINEVLPRWKAAFDIIVKAVQFAAPIVKGVFDLWMKVAQTMAGVYIGIAQTIAGVFTRIVGTVKGAVNAAIGAINGIIRAINRVQFHIFIDVPDPFPDIRFDWGGVRLATLPYLHAGGLVPGVPGSDVLAMLQAGERVTPAGQGAPTVIININEGAYIDGPSVDRLARRLTERMRLAGVG